ncbi:MAG: hypothetical protein FJ276_15735, partial [Planctomycetes bacterium]|nr:hypothetical protein [Planctomycetota bacterium]
MHLLASWFTALTAQLAALLANRTLAVVIWAGMAALTIALMILMRTRWGQVKPLSKCVVLSVFAHVLLLAYAYSTRLCQQQPGVDADDVVQLAFVASDAPPGDPEQQNLDERPWERLAEEHSVPPDTVELERAGVDAGDVPRSTQADPSPVPDVFIPPDALPAAEPARPEVEPLPPGPATPGRSQVGATAIEIPQPKRPADTEPAVPEPPTPDRMRPAPAPLNRHPYPLNPSPLPTEVADVGAQVQAMADIEARADVADTRPSPLEQTAEAENRGASQNRGVSEPRTGSDHNQSLVELPPLWRPPAATSPAAPITIEQLIDNPSHRVGDGQPVPATLRLRYAPQRQQLAEQLGSSAKSAAAVEAALAWLAAQQERDGRWDV